MKKVFKINKKMMGGLRKEGLPNEEHIMAFLATELPKELMDYNFKYKDGKLILSPKKKCKK